MSGAGHDHHHGQSHAPADFGRAFLIGIVLNVGFVVIEAVFGLLSNSMALLADAGHNLSDVLGLLLAWGAAALSKRAPTRRFTYGLRKTSVLAALFNSLFLVLAIGAVALAAIQRLGEPPAVAGLTVMVVAAAGVAVNGLTAWLFASGRKGDINIRAAFRHMAADAGVSAGVIVAGFIIFQTGSLWMDPIVSLVIVGIIFAATWGLLRDAVAMSLDAATLLTCGAGAGVGAGIGVAGIGMVVTTLGAGVAMGATAGAVDAAIAGTGRGPGTGVGRG